jgi:hypothetical protein
MSTATMWRIVSVCLAWIGLVSLAHGVEAPVAAACDEGDLLTASACDEAMEPVSDNDDPRFSSDRFYPAPPAGDILTDWMTAHLAYPGSPDPLSSDASFVAALVVGVPPYALLNRRTALFSNRAGGAARVLLEAAGQPMSRAAAVTAMAWDLGLTPSLPWITTRKKSVTYPTNVHARASMIKAGVDADIYRQARVLAGTGRVVLAANLALAAQAARDRLAHVRDPSSLALSAGIVDRFLAAGTPDELTDSDLAVLMRELEAQLSGWSGGTLSVYGKRQLPAPWRLSRLAAAYQDEFASVGDVHPCDANGMPVHRSDVGSPAPLCIDAATDRDIAAWYAGAYRSEITDWRRGPGWSPAELRLLKGVFSVVPFWVGVLHPSVKLDPFSVELARQLIATQARDGAFFPEPVTSRIFAATSERLCQAVAR